MSYNSGVVQDMDTEYQDPLDDVFGSEPFHERQHLESQSDLSSQRDIGNSILEHSEIRRLRTTHVTNGYREGIAESKSTFVQEGFDEGYPLGAMLGFKASWLVTFLDNLLRLVPERSSSLAIEAAHEDLQLQSIFSPQYFNEDGIWSYNVPGPESEQDFDLVSRHHPLISKWSAKVQELADSAGIEVELFSTRYEDGS
ncbi:Hypothetical protein D9617_22g066280 [Elsinoe fawcettii]|nr:Hypothetical protein D9617_22g066280 [Elsinoe fawcettii]